MGKENCPKIEKRKLTQITDDAEFQSKYVLFLIDDVRVSPVTTLNVTIHCLRARATGSHLEGAEAVLCSAGSFLFLDRHPGGSPGLSSFLYLLVSEFW